MENDFNFNRQSSVGLIRLVFLLCQKMTTKHNETQSYDVGGCGRKYSNHYIVGNIKERESEKWNLCECTDHYAEHNQKICRYDAQRPFFKSSASVSILDYPVDMYDSMRFINAFLMLKILQKSADNFQGVEFRLRFFISPLENCYPEHLYYILLTVATWRITPVAIPEYRVLRFICGHTSGDILLKVLLNKRGVDFSIPIGMAPILPVYGSVPWRAVFMRPICKCFCRLVVHPGNHFDHDFLRFAILLKKLNLIGCKNDHLGNIYALIGNRENRAIRPGLRLIVNEKRFARHGKILTVNSKQDFIHLRLIEHLPVKILSHILNETGVIYTCKPIHTLITQNQP